MFIDFCFRIFFFRIMFLDLSGSQTLGILVWGSLVLRITAFGIVSLRIMAHTLLCLFVLQPGTFSCLSYPGNFSLKTILPSQKQSSLGEASLWRSLVYSPTSCDLHISPSSHAPAPAQLPHAVLPRSGIFMPCCQIDGSSFIFLCVWCHVLPS